MDTTVGDRFTRTVLCIDFYWKKSSFVRTLPGERNDKFWLRKNVESLRAERFETAFSKKKHSNFTPFLAKYRRTETRRFSSIVKLGTGD